MSKKLGYPCINYAVGCTSSRTFRLASYSEERMIETVTQNLECLHQTLLFNIEHELLFFRVSSQIIPFASHPVCTFDWREHFRVKLSQIGSLVQKHQLRISMHPDQFNVINSPNDEVVERTKHELLYHAQFLDSLGIDNTHKVQVHVGGVYGDKPVATQRFIDNFQSFPEAVKRRLCIENDERSYSLRDCLELSRACNLPIIFDVFHHSLFNHGESYSQALEQVSSTWKEADGVPMVDFSTQEPASRFGKHSEALDETALAAFLAEVHTADLDIMFEVKSKENAALAAQKILSLSA